MAGFLRGLMWSAYCRFPYSECENPAPPFRRCIQLWTEALVANILSLKDYLTLDILQDVFRGVYCRFPYVECKPDLVVEEETFSWSTRMYKLLSRYFSPRLGTLPVYFDSSLSNKGTSLDTVQHVFHSVYCQLPYVECKPDPVAIEETPVSFDIFTIIETLADDVVKLVVATSKSSFVFNLMLAFFFSIVMIKLSKVICNRALQREVFSEEYWKDSYLLKLIYHPEPI